VCYVFDVTSGMKTVSSTTRLKELRKVEKALCVATIWLRYVRLLPKAGTQKFNLEITGLRGFLRRIARMMG